MSTIDTYYGPGPQVNAVWEERTIELYDNPDYWRAGSRDVQLPVAKKTIFINRVDRSCRLYVGTGNRYFIGELRPGMRRGIEIPAPFDALHIEWDGVDFAAFATQEMLNNPRLEVWMSTGPIWFAEGETLGPRLSEFYQPGIPNFTGGDFGIGDVPYQAPSVIAFPVAANTEGSGYNVLGNGQGNEIPSNMTLATMPYHQFENIGDAAYRGTARAVTATFSVVFRRGAVPFRAAVALAAGTRSPLATFWMPNTSNRYMRLHRVEIAVMDITVAADIVVDLVRIGTQPTGGTTMTPVIHQVMQHDPPVSSPLTECRSAPTGGALESANTLISMVPVRLGITGAASTASPPPVFQWQTIWDDTTPDSIVSPVLEPSIDNGFAIMAETDINTSIRYYVRALFTEHGGETLEP